VANAALATAATLALVKAVTDLLSPGAETIAAGTVQAGSTATIVNTDLTEAAANHFIGRTLYLRTGTLAKQGREITDTSGSGALTVSPAFTGAPAAGVTFVVL